MVDPAPDNPAHGEAHNRQGRVALVTGAAAGVGEAVCRQLAAAGATVVVADVDAAGAGALAGELGGTSLAFDVADRNAWDGAIEALLAEHGRLDDVVLNAGVMSRPKGEPMGSDDPLPWFEDRYSLVRAVNIDGVAFGVMATLSALRASGGGAIAVTSSMAGLVAQPEDPAYSMSKHALVGLVRSLAPTLAANGVTIGAVCPAGIDTSLVPPDYRDAGYAFAPPSHVAATLVDVLDKPGSETGGIWVTLGVDEPIWRYEFAPLR